MLCTGLLLVAGSFVALPAAAAPPGVSPSGKAGVMVAWGFTDNQPYAAVPDGLRQTRVVAVATAQEHDIGLTPDGKIVIWGFDPYGQLDVPPSLASKTVTAIAAKEYHSLALTSDGTVTGWGDNSYGESDVPVALTGVTAIAAGGHFSLALTGDGTVHAWGDDRAGQTTVPAGLTGVTAIAAGYDHSLALTSAGTVVGWGTSTFGQTQPPAALTGKVVTAIAAGYQDSVALTSDGTVVAWGDDSDGQTHVPVAPSTAHVAITAGLYHDLVLDSDGAVTGWGLNQEHQLTQPPQVALRHKLAVDAGVVHSIAIVVPQIVFLTDTPDARATAGDDYGYQFTADAYPAPTFSLASGSLPPGLTLGPDGSLSGSPRDVGSYTFRVRASNGVDPDALSAEHTITVGAHAATQLLATSGGDQTAAAGHTFAAPLVAEALDVDAAAVPGVAVVFSLPTGAGAPTFVGGGSTAAAVTGEGGTATSPAVVAGTAVGPVTASVSTAAGGPDLHAAYALSVTSDAADLKATVHAPARARTSHRVAVTLKVRDKGPAAAASTHTELILPKHWRVVDADGGVRAGRVITWDSTTLPSHGVSRYDVVLTTGPVRGADTLTVQTSSATSDPHPGNNVASVRVRLHR